MTERADEEIITQIKELIVEQVQPAVAGHGGNIEFLSYDTGALLLELQGACSGCAGSTATLKYGVEQMIKHFVPEVTSVEALDGVSEVDPYYSSVMDNWDMIPMSQDGLDHE
jgi:Fe-S cluster biogenesis protein NfuA